MLSKALGKVFSSRVFYIIFSLLVSVALWMFVEITENQDLVFDVSNIPVVYRHEDILRDRGMLISSVDPEFVTLRIECPRSLANKLTSRTLAAEIDLSGIRSTGPAELIFQIIYPTGLDQSLISVESRSVERIRLIVDRSIDRTFPVRVNYRGGTASDDLIAETAEYDPQSIIVSGPEEVISKIDHIYVPIPRENLSSTLKADLGFVLMDENGDELEQSLLDSLTLNHDTVRVTIPIRQMKEVPLAVELIHGAGTSWQNVSVSIDPPRVRLSGDPDAIKDFNSIVLGTIDMMKFALTNTEAFTIRIPNHFTNISGETEARVFIEVLGLDIDYRITSNLQVINTPADYRDEILTQSLDVKIRGRREDLDHISQPNIWVVADLRDLRPGTQQVPARVSVDGFDADVVGAVGEYYITVRVFRDTE